MTNAARKVTARKTTVTKIGVRGESYRVTTFKPVVNGVTLNYGFPTREDAIAFGEKGGNRHGF